NPSAPYRSSRHVTGGYAGYLRSLGLLNGLKPLLGFHAALQGRTGSATQCRNGCCRLEPGIARSYAHMTRRGPRHANTIQDVSASHVGVAITSRCDPATP